MLIKPYMLDYQIGLVWFGFLSGFGLVWFGSGF